MARVERLRILGPGILLYGARPKALGLLQWWNVESGMGSDQTKILIIQCGMGSDQTKILIIQLKDLKSSLKYGLDSSF